MKNENQEQWKEIEGYPRYEVSNLGRVRSNTTKSGKKKILKNFNANGYEYVTLMSGISRGTGKSKRRAVHRLVAQAFIPNPEGKKEVDHIIPVQNGGKPVVSNLRWVTKLENAANPITVHNNKKAREQSMKRVYQYDEQLNLINSFKSTLEASQCLNKSQGNIANCCAGVWKRYCGYIFSYVPLSTLEERQAIENSDEADTKRMTFKTQALQAVKRYIDRHKFDEKWRQMTRESSRRYHSRKRDEQRKKKEESNNT